MGPTVGALFILNGVDFDMILGMPWMEKNFGSVAVRELGTFIGHSNSNLPSDGLSGR